RWKVRSDQDVQVLVLGGSEGLRARLALVALVGEVHGGVHNRTPDSSQGPVAEVASSIKYPNPTISNTRRQAELMLELILTATPRRSSSAMAPAPTEPKKVTSLRSR